MDDGPDFVGGDVGNLRANPFFRSNLNLEALLVANHIENDGLPNGLGANLIFELLRSGYGFSRHSDDDISWL